MTPPTAPVSPLLAAEQVTVTPFAASRKSVTVIDAVVLREPLVAVTVAVPPATAVTKPDEDTVAMDELVVDQVTV